MYRVIQEDVHRFTIIQGKKVSISLKYTPKLSSHINVQCTSGGNHWHSEYVLALIKNTPEVGIKPVENSRGRGVQVIVYELI